MPEQKQEDDIVWTTEMPDRRKGERRNGVQDFQANGRALNVSEYPRTIDRRRNRGRRKTDQVTLTITGRAMEVDLKKEQSSK
jgi:hypothetical protein